LPDIPRKFILFSTLDVYKPGESEIITETTLTEPVSLYGWSKLYGEKMLEAWARKENVIIQVLRIGHIYGSGEEKYQKIIPATIRRVLEKQPPVIFTKGNELRSFLHISDCINSVIASITLDNYEGPINIVSGCALPVKQIVSTIVNEIDPSITIDIQGNDVPVRNLVFDSSKMRQFLGEELISFEDGIKEEISNFKL
jgi:nucleoside-diphosphate-sugar epimerase